MRQGDRDNFSGAGGFESAAGLAESGAGRRDVINQNNISAFYGLYIFNLKTVF